MSTRPPTTRRHRVALAALLIVVLTALVGLGRTHSSGTTSTPAPEIVTDVGVPPPRASDTGDAPSESSEPSPASRTTIDGCCGSDGCCPESTPGRGFAFAVLAPGRPLRYLATGDGTDSQQLWTPFAIGGHHNAVTSVGGLVTLLGAHPETGTITTASLHAVRYLDATIVVVRSIGGSARPETLRELADRLRDSATAPLM